MKKMFEKFKKNKLSLILMCISLILIIVGIASAFFIANFSGIRNTVLNIDGLEFTYEEESNNLLLENVTVLSDIAGKAQNNYFDFTVSLKSANELDVNYIVYLTKDSSSTLSDSMVKLYLTDQSDVEILAPKSIDTLLNYSKVPDSKIIYSTSISSDNSVKTTDYYRLRIWLGTAVDDDINYYEDDDEQGYIQGGGTYKFKVHVATFLTAEETPEYCFEYEVGVESTNISAYKCYEGNDYDLPTITDVVIPSLLGGKNVTSIIDLVGGDDGGFKKKGLTSIVIPSTVKELGVNIFRYNEISSATLSEGLEIIGMGAFAENSLTSISFPSTVHRIEYDAFSYNYLEGTIIIPDNVTYLDGAVFAENNITGFVLPSHMTIIPMQLFSGNNITTVVIPSNIKTIKESAFSNNKISSLTLPEGLVTLEVAAFSNNLLTTVTIPTTITNIGPAFSYNQLTNINFHNGITTISGGAFSHNKLTSVTIPNSVTSLSGFDNNLLTSITIPNNVTSLSGFNNNQLTSVTIPNNVTTIGQAAFVNNQLTKVTLGNGVTTIGNNAFNKTASSNPGLTSIVNPTGRFFGWGNIVNGTGTPAFNFPTGTVTNSNGNVIISAS